MSGFSELIKSFDKTRDYMRDFFIYGYKVRNDFKRKSSRTYDDEKRRVESWLGNFLRYEDSARGRKISICVDSGHIHENPLYQAYYSKSFTDNDIKLHFFLLDILRDKSPLSLRELTEELDKRFGILFDEQTVRNKLKEYADEEIILTEKHGKTAYFRSSDDSAEKLFDEIKGLTDAVKFYSETQKFGVIGNSILKSLGLKNDLFFMKHNYIVHTLEDEILLKITEAMRQKCFVVLRSFSGKQRHTANPTENENTVLPLQILSSVQTGRRYLAGYLPDFKRFNSFRLDSIRSVKLTECAENYRLIQEKYEKNMKKCFGVSFGERRDSGTVTPIKIILHIDEKNEGFVIERLDREKRCGTVEKIAENTFAFTADVFDPFEVMHWAKTFIGRIVSVEGGCDAARDMFRRDIYRMEKMYITNKINEENTENGESENKNDNIQ